MREADREAGARGKGRAVSATALAGCGRARDGRVGGERRIRDRGAEFAGDRHEGVAGVGRERHGTLTGDGPRDEDAGNFTLPIDFFGRCNHVTMV